MNVKLAEIKKADPKLTHSDAFQKAFNAWKVSLSFLPRCPASVSPRPPPESFMSESTKASALTPLRSSCAQADQKNKAR